MRALALACQLEYKTENDEGFCEFFMSQSFGAPVGVKLVLSFEENPVGFELHLDIVNEK